jgi:hypothetical protein
LEEHLGLKRDMAQHLGLKRDMEEHLGHESFRFGRTFGTEKRHRRKEHSGHELF